MMRIAVVDYGMGNLRSVARALNRVAPEAEVEVTDCPERLHAAHRIVFPGQGALPDCMRRLHERHLLEVVRELAQTRPFLGICLGLQVLFEHSEEGEVAGLGLLTGKVRRFPVDRFGPQGERLKVPHMGWNEVHATREHSLWRGLAPDSRFYFVHSYYVQELDETECAATTTYGFPFTSAVIRDNLCAVQFHPEKSASAGLTLLSNFVHWTP
ncbi:imidazole glycerol phosphate synthase subunit HisH [Ferrovum sp.]|uniref:imidazole glycerol phosphate synthase subunit HisH n=1 Tax=Ferrovum sp. TaxID=2609467 RepID=UPI003446F758